jgi:tRNA dimethylallyltransferase
MAEALDAEIVCVDSMLVYRGMDIGTAKPTAEQRARVPHHLLDIAEPTEPFSVARYQGEARAVLAGIERRGRRALLVSGGGLYYRAVVDGLRFPGRGPRTRALLETEAVALGPDALHQRLAAFDPEAAARIDRANARRTVRALEVVALTGRAFSEGYSDWAAYPSDAVGAAGVDLPNPVLHRRIEERVRAILPGLLEETRALLARGAGPFLTSSQAIGYAESVACLEGRIDQEEAARRTVSRTKALARRQLSWLRRDPRVRWFRAGEGGAVTVLDELIDHLAGLTNPAAAARPAALEV